MPLTLLYHIYYGGMTLKKIAFIIIITVIMVCIIAGGILLHHVTMLQSQFVSWCKTISLENMDEARISRGYHQGGIEHVELTTEDRVSLVEILNDLGNTDLVVRNLHEGIPDLTLYLVGNGERYVLKYWSKRPDFVYVSMDYDEATIDVFNVRAKTWIKDADLISFMIECGNRESNVD